MCYSYWFLLKNKKKHFHSRTRFHSSVNAPLNPQGSFKPQIAKSLHAQSERKGCHAPCNHQVKYGIADDCLWMQREMIT